MTAYILTPACRQVVKFFNRTRTDQKYEHVKGSRERSVSLTLKA
jgi:hypothetical protein